MLKHIAIYYMASQLENKLLQKINTKSNGITKEYF